MFSVHRFYDAKESSLTDPRLLCSDGNAGVQSLAMETPLRPKETTTEISDSSYGTASSNA
jgi:hypothetical protein